MFLNRLRRNQSNRLWRRLLLSHSVELKMAVEYFSSKADFSKNLRPMIQFKPVTHVIFDMDGLLLDTEIIYKQIISKIVESHRKKYTSELQLMVLGTTEQATAEIVVRECRLPITVDDFLKKFREMQMTYLANAKLMEGAEELVRHLSSNNVPMAVATSSGEKSVEVKTAAHKQLFSLFHHIVMGSSDPEVKHGKPAPDIFLVCANRFPGKPKYEECLVFEDAPNGVIGATAAGMQTVMVPDTVLPPEKATQATLIVDSLKNFKPEVFGLPSYK